jgi:hypothetical protein
MNQRLVVNILAEQRQEHGAEPFLIEPEQKPIAYEGRYPFGTPATMPPIACVARFDSEPARDLTKNYSSLVIVWFQEHFSLAIEDASNPHWKQSTGTPWQLTVSDRMPMQELDGS